MWKRLAACLALLCAVPARAEVPRVVTSIVPLQSLAASVMAGVGEPAVVVSGQQSEHTYSLKPSDARLLESADLVVLASPQFETFLERPLKRLANTAEVVAMADLPGMRRLPLRDGGIWEADHDGHDDGHGDVDGHLWLDPANAKVLVAVLAERLSLRDPAHAADYRANADAERARLDALDAELRDRLSPLAGKPYAVFHDAYHYIEARYGLTPAGALTVDPDRPVSARRLAELKQRLVTSRAACVFREPQFPAPVVERLAQSAGARVGVLDPLGANLPIGPGQYEAMMEQIADSLSQCLSNR